MPFRCWCKISNKCGLMPPCMWRVEQTCWGTVSWRCCFSMNITSSIPALAEEISRLLWRLYTFPCGRAHLSYGMYERQRQDAINTGVGLFISDKLPVLQHRLDSAIWSVFSGQSMTCGTNVLKYWKLTMLPQSERPRTGQVFSRLLFGLSALPCARAQSK